MTSWSAFTGGGTGDDTLNSAYDNGNEITVDSGAVTLNGSHATNVLLDLNYAGSGTGNMIDIQNDTTGSAGKDIEGTDDTWSFTAAGVCTATGLIMADNQAITLGTGSDATIQWDGSKLDIAGVANFDGNVTVETGHSLTITNGSFTHTAGDATIDDGSLTITDADNAGTLSVTNNTLTDGGNLVTLRADAITDKSILYIDNGGASLTTGYYINCNDDGVAEFTVGDGGITTIAGGAASNVFNITAGDMVMSDGSITVTDADAATSFSLTNNSVATADLAVITSTGLTTGALLKLNANGAAHDGEVLEIISAGDATSTPKGISVTMTSVSTSTGADSAHGIWVDLPEATSGANGIEVRMDKITTADMLKLDAGGGTMTGAGRYINCVDDATEKFSVASDGATTIAGTAAGTTALTLTKGDLVITDTDTTTITSVDGTGNTVEIISGGAVGAGKGTLTIDQAGELNATGALLRLEADDVTATNSPYAMQVAASGVDVGGFYVDTDAATNDACVINADGNLGAGKFAMKIDIGGTPGTGSGALKLDATGTFGGDERIMEISGSGKDAIGLYIDVDTETGNTVHVQNDGAIASGKAVIYADAGGVVNAAGYGILAEFTGAAAAGATVIGAIPDAGGVGIKVAGGGVDTQEALYVDADPTAHDVSYIHSDAVIASDKGLLQLDHATGASAAGSTILRIKESATPNADAIGFEMDVQKDMIAAYIDSDAATNSAVTITGAGDLANNKAMLHVLNTGTINAGSSLVRIESGASAAGATAYGLEIACNGTNLEGLYVSQGETKFAEAVTIDAGGETITAGDLTMTAGNVKKSINAGVTADTGSSQGDGAQTKDIIEIATCANAGDAITLPPAAAGLQIMIINRGANSADVFPATGDNINEAGANTAKSLAANAGMICTAIDETHWECWTQAR